MRKESLVSTGILEGDQESTQDPKMKKKDEEEILGQC